MQTMKKYLCVPCGWEYDPLVGDADADIPPGVDFNDLPDDWVSPLCGAGKEDFVPME